ncbi:MAG: hypothetical protein ACXU9D_23390, partial [Xanthobacteraceae bacterium]
NRSFFATGLQETEITNEFALVFNKFARTMAVQMGRSPRGRERSGTGKDISRPEGVMGKTVRKAPGLAADLVEFVQNLARSLFDPYRPEQHYMRGPGPKWHAKHDRAHLAYRAIPVLVPVRVKR